MTSAHSWTSRCILAMLLSLSLSPASAKAATPAAWAGQGAQTDQAAIAKLEQRWLAAVQPDGNRQDLQTILADDFVDVDWQGRVRHKSDLIAAPPGAKDVVQHVTGMRIRVWGDTAVATGVNVAHSTSKGWTVEVPFTDVFARIDGHWRAVSSQETLRQADPVRSGASSV